jgi:glycosyltransferase involved in cell wall biosynthesis
MGVGAKLAARRVPVVLEVHDAPGSGRHSRLTDRIEGWWVRHLGAIAVCHSSSVEQALHERWGATSPRVARFPLAVDAELFKPLDDEARRAWRAERGIPEEMVIFVGVGRLVSSKRFDILVRALRSARPRSSQPIGLVLIGEGPEHDTIRAAIEEEPSGATNVWMLGSLYGSELAEAVGAADVMCSPSEYEGFGLTIIEGMASRLPVIAYGVGGVTDLVIDGENGILLTANDPETWAASMIRVAEDRGERERLGTHGAHLVAEVFGIQRFAEEFCLLYERLAGRVSAD